MSDVITLSVQRVTRNGDMVRLDLLETDPPTGLPLALAESWVYYPAESELGKLKVGDLVQWAGGYYQPSPVPK